MQKLEAHFAMLFGAILLTACQASGARSPALRDEVAAVDVERDGRDIAQTQCSSCHAVEKAGLSPVAAAPPFREMAQHYSLAALEVELDNGLPTGHPPMPRFKLAPRGVDALIAYMRAIQIPKAASDGPPQ